MQKQIHPTRRTFLKQTLAATAALPLPFHALAQSERKFILNAPLTHSDWFLKPNIAWGPEGVHHMLDACKKCGWNRVLWRVFDAGRANYKSKLLRADAAPEKSSFWNPETDEEKALVKRIFPGVTEERRNEIIAKFESIDYTKFDSFAEAIRYGHKIGLQIHAWASINEDDHGWGWRSEFAIKHPEFAWKKRNGKMYHSQMSFSYPEVREYKLELLKELLNYDLDGIFLDWIRTGDVRDNPQNDPEGVADYGYEKPNTEKFRERFGKEATSVPRDDDAWVRLRAEPQTEFMRAASRLIRKRKIPLSVMVGHPWHYRGLQEKIDGNLRGLLLDVNTWAREGLMDSAIAAGYYRDGGNAEMATRALQKETENKVDVWTYAWMPNTVSEAEQTFALAENVGAKQILYWEADYIDDRANKADLQAAMSKRAAV
jgi:hypothetical protein